MKTPICFYDKVNNTDVYIKREDLMPGGFGGNKVRIADELFSEALLREAKAIISYGSASSNLNRVISQKACEKGLKCYLIIKENNIATSHPTFNELMAVESGAEIIFTAPEEVGKTVRETIERATLKGENPFYVYGDYTGHGNEEILARAYEKVAAEIMEQEEELGLRFDRIYVAVGTGSTLKGLVNGFNGERGITGISISREKADILKVLDITESDNLSVTDEYLFGGYGYTNEELTGFIRSRYHKYGLPLDHTYTGKAFYGSIEEIKKSQEGQNVLFIHTGGIPLFFDMLETVY
ncbi:MAG: pyridoxal-phosphate dependent enzyme [Eubacteriales bacterium]|nr:pyridoxal-phosphate dependent enzyme [Eubacteriales bacterium]